MTLTTLHARCAIVVPSATMSVQIYAGSGTTCGCCSSDWSRARAVCLIRTTVGQ